ncbi:ataxia telangiectasia mutated [Histoplasma capsulatum G186AR]|uniref:Serine/threonine-protein kinase Tel1 n=1 Tax=Ajellomyces capsulatus (strain G186AR / H82 / ATCC MYA-2454 / RMSCC 2432) TaxID=447093 RepID=C0NFH1_AJECG|nr:ataxia telangiectasia mutated [Histoplasma capsulatum G186AR]EEH09992.1 ataxia telangiectasia mutated [Histoplasma capsulatum G186AR]
MKEVSLEDALRAIGSDLQRNRVAGLEDKHLSCMAPDSQSLNCIEILTLNGVCCRNNLTDKEYHKIFETLFRFISTEKSSYKRTSKTPVSKSTSGTRLTSCVSALRATVELGVHKIRSKTVAALLDHVTDAIQTLGDALWELLSGDYIKILKTILQYPPHLEHLSKGDWHHVVNFCLQATGVIEPNQETQLSIRSRTRLPSESLGDRGSRASSIEPDTLRRNKSSGFENSTKTEELETCMQLLCSYPSAPIIDDAEKLLHGLVDYLQSQSSISKTPHAAFSAFNSVLAKLITYDIILVRDALLDVIPIIKRFWRTKSAILKDEMLITLMIGRPIFVQSSLSSPPDSFAERLQDLTEQLYQEYTRQPEKDFMQVDDLVFTFDQPPRPMGIRTMAPRLGVPRSEQTWITLQAIAVFSTLLDNMYLSLDEGPQTTGRPNKKQHLLSRRSDIVREASSSAGVTRICALQLLPFIFSEREPVVEELLTTIAQLTVNILDENSSTASWTMVALASMASFIAATSQELRPLWVQVWELTCRALGSPTTSRTACNLLTAILHFELLDYSIVGDTIESMISSVDLNGPSGLTDSALRMWAKLVDFRTKFNPAQNQDMSKQICTWIRNSWTLTDRVYTMQVATFARPLDLLNILMKCTGRSFDPPYPVLPGPLCRISRCFIRLRQDCKLIDYLFLTARQGPANETTADTARLTYISSSVKQHPDDQLILELLQSKIDNFCQIWSQLNDDNHQHVTIEIIQILVSLCITSTVFTQSLPLPVSLRCQYLQKSTEKLWVSLCGFFSRNEVEFLDSCLDVLSPIILRLKLSFDINDPVMKAIQLIAPDFIAVLDHHNGAELDSSNSAADQMDLDNHFSSQDSHIRDNDFAPKFDREDIPAYGDQNAVRRATATHLHILYYLNGANKSSEAPRNGTIVAHVTSLDTADILAARTNLVALLGSWPSISRSDACSLLVFFGETILQSYEFKMCEAALSICIELTTAFIDLWTTDEDDELFESAVDLYNWYALLVEESLGSPRVLIRIATLMGRILRADPMYPRDSSRPSPRTILFKILHDGDLTVKFHLSGIIPSVFDGFILKEHDAIFDDILENLPRDPDRNEGIALRLYLLAQLASRWHTLLRRGIYHIFEAPGQLPKSAPYAKACLQEVARSLNLDDAKEIFRLFASQMIYTWLETESLGSIPFTIFGYQALNDLLIDVEDEVVAQIVMRGKDQEMTEVSNCLGMTFRGLLEHCFYKAEAYCIARDISIPPSQDSQPKGTQGRIKKILGAEQFGSLLERYFPETIAVFFKCVDQTEQMERGFEKRPAFKYALDIWKDIAKRSSSTAVLPASQQPSFRARYLLDEFDFLCTRTGYDLETMWTPALVCFVARTLIESIHPSLGSLHACAVIRKLKILVCVAGSVVLDEYPLEMLLHFLRSFLSDFHCSEDAVGLFWYLIDKGRPYLLENPYFMAGLGVSTLASLRGLLSSSQESTTQETHFRSSISKAQIFHDWFAKFLDEYESPKLSKESGKSFRTIVQSAQRINLVGSASKGTYEGELLVGLLQDSAPGERLLSAPATDLVFSLICNDFQRPKDFRDDILGEDKVAAANAVTVWNTIQHRDHSSGYRLWAARVLGRAYASTGVVNDSMLKETQSSPPDDIPERVRLTSKISIIRILYNSLFSNSRRDIGLAERALQQIFTSLHSEPDLGECASAIPSSLLKALTWTPYLCPDLSLTALQRAQFNHDVRWIADAPAEEWARDFTLCLSVREATNSVVGTLPKVLFEMPALAMKLLPYILHDRLLSEYEGKRIVRQAVSDVFRQAFRDVRQTTFPHIRLIIHCILHLRHQKIPHEQTMNQRDAWLDIDYLQAAHAAAQCKMYKTSLLFVEIHFSRTSSTRRLAASKLPDSLLLLHDIFKNIEDPDLFYGIQQSATLDSVLEKLQHESAGFGLKNLSFQSANYEAEMKLSGSIGETSTLGLIRALNTTNFQGVANAMFTAPTSNGKRTEIFENMLSTSLHLQQWDIPMPSSSPSAAGNVFKVLQSLNSSDDKLQVARILDNSFSEVLHNLEKNQSHVELRDMMRAIGILAEIDQVMCSQNLDQLQDAWERIQAKGSWLKFESFRDVSLILSSHEALFSLINRQPHIKSMLSVSSHDAQLLEVKTIRESLKICREHDEHQASLKSAISLSKLIKPCAELGVFIDAAATFDLANVLWDQGEMTTSIQMLQQLSEQNDLQNQSIAVNKAEILASLGRHVAEARLQKPDTIMQEYLLPAIKELKGKSEGEEAGRVFHEFAVFCDQQLQNPDSLEDFRRIEQIRHRKEREVLDLEQMIESARNKERESLLMHISRAKQWFELDDKEYQRLKESRVSFLRQCLEKYLLSLKASDKFKNNVLRFCALWLDNSESEAANGAVAKYINAVPSRMFAPLMNQLSSRLLDVEDSFQPLLANLIFRICREHPYHGMYQIFNSSRSTRGRDHMGTSRYRAANSLVDRLKVDPKACATWLTLHNTNVIYVRFATDRLDNGLKSGSKVALRKTVAGQRLEQDIRRQRIPPPTMKIDLRIDCDYSQIPRIVRYLPEFTVASGVSAPKIVSAIASDGLLYRQLRFKEPDDWFSKRLAYTRSTAAISMLGHVLGLGDRHGHNILLDEKTGEVVHIDLGVAFEQGRVLPIPEVVPFRLTRDLVDGMGVTKTEGVFRRCCEFTLEALRRESYSIMTILDVLRYDPLYSWSLSPLRIKKMQDTQEAAEGAAHVNESGKSKNPNEPSEADRALTVVAKKLGKTLSVAATVNELIQQATDERNLALLYCGWAAYA